MKVAYLDTAYDMWTYALMLLCGVALAAFFTIKPLETVLVYFMLSPVLQLFNDMRIAIPGTKAEFSFGGIILSIVLIFGGLACLNGTCSAYRKTRGIIVLFMLFIGWMMISMLMNLPALDLLRSIKELGRIVGVFVVFLLGLRYSTDLKDIHKFLATYFISLVIPICMAGYQIAFGTKYLQLENFNRVMGTFGIPNMFGMYLIFPLIMLLIIALDRRRRDFSRPLAWLFLLILLIVLFFTYTRASWLAFIMGVLYFGVKRYRGLIPFIGAFGVILIGTFSLEALRLGSTGSSGRLDIWLSLLPVGFSAPIFGHGVTSTSSLSLAILGFPNQGQNQYLLYLLEGGFPAVVFFVSLLMVLYNLCHGCIHEVKDKGMNDFFLGLCAFLIGMYMIAFFESNAIFQNWVWLPCGVFLGSLYNSLHSNETSQVGILP
jgi:O-antigen ligase